MGGHYKMFVPHGTLVLALDDDGGTDIADYALAHGVEAAVDAFTIWLSERVKEQAADREVAERRRKIKVISRTADRKTEGGAS